MPESAIEAGGPSLEQILWRAMDRFEERPALVDAEEFAARIEDVFDGDVPAEAWVARFFEGGEKLRKAPSDMAEAIVRATRDRLAVYEFDLHKLEYVIVEDEEKVVVVSGFGQFALQNDDTVSRAIESAVIAPGRGGSVERGGGEPRAYFVRASGEVVGVDVNKVARSLERLLVRQVSMPAVDRPAGRLLPFAPSKRSMTESREAQALRQDLRARQALPAAPRLERTRASDVPRAPAGTHTTLFVLMPDGTLARPEMGSATRWQQMLGSYAGRAAASAGPAAQVTAGQRVTVQAGNVVAIINNHGSSTSVGERALLRSEGISAVRADAAPVRVMSDDALLQALEQGAMVVPGLSRADKFWIQPEAAFKPDERPLAQGGKGPQTAEPLRLGEITGDPWADWALTGGGEMSPDLMMALRGRSKHALRAALDRDTNGDDVIPPALADKLRGVRGQELKFAGAPVVGFRAPDGSVVVNRATGPIRLAALDRPDGALQPIDLQLPGTDEQQLAAILPLPIAVRSGALPATALAALQMALEQTANTSGYKLPALKIASARDALDAGAAMDMPSFDPRRTSVRLAGSPSWYDGGEGNQVAQLVLSMPFPNSGELHVGDDLSEALQAYLGGAVQPAAFGGVSSSLFAPMAAGAGLGAGISLRFSKGPAQEVIGSDGMPLDWGGLHTQAIQRAQDAMVTIELPSVQPLVAGSSSVSGLPVLLQRALAQSGDWTPGPGAPVPLSVREFALKGPFEMVAGGVPDLAGAGLMPQARPLNPGEEEIVIPMPLWAQMGRGQLSETEQVMASPLAPTGYAPPMGVYRLVVPAGGPVDMTGGAPQGTPGIVELAGPTGLEIALQKKTGAVVASTLGGHQLIGRVAVDDGETVVSRRGRIRIGAPIDPSIRTGGTADSGFQPGSTLVSQGAFGPDSSPAVVSGAQPSFPSVDAQPATYIDGSYTGASSAAGTTGAAPMASALTSAMQMSSDVAGRTSMPSRPGIASGASSSQAITSDSSGFASRAQAAGQQSAGSASLPSSASRAATPSGNAASTATVVTGAPEGPSATGTSSGGNDAALAAVGVQGAIAGAQIGSGFADMTHASSAARSATASSESFVTGLQPGMWNGRRRTDIGGYQAWSYGPGRDDSATSSGGVVLSALSRPVYPSLPTSLRFRYVGAPLWWSGSSGGGIAASADAGDEDSSAPATRAMKAGLRAATSAASIWRSILVASPQWGGGDVDDFSGGMDSGKDAAADDMSSLARNFDALTAASVVGAGAGGGAAASGAAYVAFNGSGAAGTVSRSAAARARADSVEMSIVAAIPPAPPPLETTGAGGMTGGNAPHARAKGHGHGHQDHKEGAEAVSHSKIEGSVDAIAQRIYHRIRRRIQSDRERFGG